MKLPFSETITMWCFILASDHKLTLLTDFSVDGSLNCKIGDNIETCASKKTNYCAAFFRYNNSATLFMCDDKHLCDQRKEKLTYSVSIYIA